MVSGLHFFLPAPVRMPSASSPSQSAEGLCPPGIPGWLSATSFRTRTLQLTALPPGAVPCVSHSISARKGQEQHSRDVCTVCSVVCMAYAVSHLKFFSIRCYFGAF